MSTIVYLHAHPDDESSQTSGTMARAADGGHAVHVVFATGGEFGESPADLGDAGSLAEYRRREAERSAAVIGLAGVHWLGYSDSGMTGWEQNDAAGSFHGAALDEAGRRLADVLDALDADVVVGYDWHGGYGHPDHVKVHHTAHRAAELAARRPRVLEATLNRDAMRRGRDAMRAALLAGVDHDPGSDPRAEAGDGGGGFEEFDFDPDGPMDDGNPLGTPEAEIHWEIDVRDLIERKRAAMECHRSQTTDIGGMLAMPADMFAQAFGYEYLIEPGRPAGMVSGWPFDG